MNHPNARLTRSARPLLARWRHWWRQQSPTHQDRFAMLAPVAAVLLFLLIIALSFWYLRLEEVDREREAVKRDLEYAQQRLRLRLLERQEQLMRLARDISNKEVEPEAFRVRAESLVSQYPELQSITWIDERRNIVASQTTPSVLNSTRWIAGEVLKPGATDLVYNQARELMQPVYAPPMLVPAVPPALGVLEPQTPPTPLLQLLSPLSYQGQFAGVVLGEYSIDGLLRYGVPAEISAKYAVALLDGKGAVLAGQSIPQRPNPGGLSAWITQINEDETPIAPVGSNLVLRVQAWRTSLGMIGNGLFWLVAALSALTTWMLMANWRHMRRRIQAQHSLVTETTFRRAMENSMLTGMRALDMQGRITYVNPAFCRMTGWREDELVGQTAPFPYWPDDDRDYLAQRLDEELHGLSTPGGFQVRVKRKDSSVFDARLYVSPLIDATGKQAGWMTSITDITEPNRIREQLSASYERFTAVLEALDASVSVAPLGSGELLFANKLYRLWFGINAAGHLQLIEQAGSPQPTTHQEELDDVDAFAGLPTGALTQASTENTEIFVPQLGKWIEVRSRYLNWVDGRLAQMVIATDITPRRNAEELAAAQAARAQSVSRLITMGEMASSVAHELNQPLTAISNYCTGMVSRIKNQQISEADLLTALEKTAKQAQRAGQIIQRIRSFVKRSEPNRTHADVAEIVNEAVELAEIELRRHNVQLSHYVAARLPRLHVDPILIEQVLVNLLKNAAESIHAALRAPSERNVELRVLPKHYEGLNVVEFSVTDTGLGLSAEVKDRLYEAFFSTKAEGMGIGLSLCRSIIESHQGRMQARNIYNGQTVVGCCFSFWIPVTKPPVTSSSA
jgi:PAS domain S-box-containing protein